MRKLYTIIFTILLFFLLTTKVKANIVYPHHLNLFEAGLYYYNANNITTQVVNCTNNKCENSITGLVSLDSLRLTFNPLENQETEHAVFNGYIMVQNLVPVGAGQPSEMPSLGSVGLTSSDHQTPMGICEIKNINANNPNMGSVAQTTNSSTGVTYNIYQSTINYQVDCYLGDTRLQTQYNYDLQFYFNNGQGVSGATFNVTSLLNYNYASYDGEYNNNLDLIRQAILGIQVGGGASSQDITNQTQEILQNQNDIADQQYQEQLVCSTIDKNAIKIENKYLNSNGVESTSVSTLGITDYIKIDSNSTLQQLISGSGSTVTYNCFYNVNKDKISCIQISSIPNNTDITIPNNAEYVRFTIERQTNQPQYRICRNGNQAIDDSLNSVNNSITDVNNTLNNSDVSQGNSKMEDIIENFEAPDYGFAEFIFLPFNFFRLVLTSTCQPIQLHVPYVTKNDTITLPCYNTILQQNFPELMTLIHIVTDGLIVYYCCVTIFRTAQNVLDPEKANLEVFDL